jgi:hypothetical protein
LHTASHPPQKTEFEHVAPSAVVSDAARQAAISANPESLIIDPLGLP